MNQIDCNGCLVAHNVSSNGGSMDASNGTRGCKLAAELETS